MMKRLKISGCILIVLLLSNIIHIVNSEPEESTPTYVNSYIEFVDNDLSENSGERVVWSNYTGLFYIFTHFDYDIIQHSETHSIVGYAYSPDGKNFVVVDDFFQSISVHARATYGNFDFTLSPDNRYIWFAWKVELGDYDSLYIVKCELELNGSITPLTSEQLVVSGSVGADHLEGWIDIEVSSLGYPFVAYLTHDTYPLNVYFAWCRWSNYDNGTWIYSGQKNFDALLTWNKDDSGWEVSKLLRLEDGKMGWACDFADSFSNWIWKLYVGFYDGTSWIDDSAIGLYGDSVATQPEHIYGYKRTDITSFNDSIIGAYVTRTGGKTKLLVRQANYGSAFGGTTEVVGTYPDIGTEIWTPNLSTDYNGNIIISIYEHGSSSVNYTYRYSNGTWGPLGLSNLIKWYGNESQTFNWNQFTSSAKSDNFIGFVYQDNSYAYMEILFDYISLNGNMLPVAFEYYNTTIDNLHNGWMFRGERYKITSYVKGASTYKVNFTDGLHNIAFRWDNESKKLYVDNDLDRELLIGLYASNYVEYSDGTQKFEWDFILDVNIHDYLNTSFHYEIYNEEYDSTLNGDTGLSVNIYSLGAIVSYDFDGDAGKIVGGDSLEIQHTNSTGTGALVEVIYRRLQHSHLEWWFDVDDNDCFDEHENTGVIQIGVKYLNGVDSWVDGWYLELSIVNGAVDGGGGGLGKAWIIPYVTWYAMDTTGTTQAIKNDILSGYPECGDDVNEDISHTVFYTDLWFNTMNSSTTIGGRINTKYYGMDEGGWMLWTDWSPYRTNVTESMFFYDLLDTTGNVTQPIDIELMKFYIRVLKSGSGSGSDCDTHTWSIKNPKLSVRLAGDRMSALDTPEGIDTLVIDMPSAGFLQPITKALQGLGNAISGAMFGVIKMLMGAMDTLLIDVLHSPVSMSQMISWVMIQSSYITTWMVQVLAKASDMLNVFTVMMSFILQLIDNAVGVIMWVSTNVIGFPIVVLNMFIQIFNDGVFTLYGVTYDWSSGNQLIQGFLTLLPLFLGWWFVMWILYDNIYGDREIDIQGVPRRLLSVFSWMGEIYNSVFWIFNRMRNEIISLYNFIRSHIPQIGGGGGETKE